MSVKNLYKSLEDRERVPKIQGLLNECMTFLDDELSIITGPYEDSFSIDEVIDQDLILFVSLNVKRTPSRSGPWVRCCCKIFSSSWASGTNGRGLPTQFPASKTGKPEARSSASSSTSSLPLATRTSPTS